MANVRAGGNNNSNLGMYTGTTKTAKYAYQSSRAIRGLGTTTRLTAAVDILAGSADAGAAHAIDGAAKGVATTSKGVAGAAKLILGGPMMGLAQASSEIPVSKGTSGVLVMRRAAPIQWRACIHCGRCVEVCPMRLVPSEISIACESGDLEAVAATSILDCFECGSCTYVCPAKRPIVHWVKWGKAELARKKAEQRGAKAS